MTVITLCIFSLGLCILGMYILSGLRSPRLLPGPKGLPIIGNLLELSKLWEAEHWAKHKEIYGPISYVAAFGLRLVIINSPEIAHELLEKRSAKYSSRASLVLPGEIVGHNQLLVFSPKADQVRLHRRNIARVIGTKPLVSKYDEVQEAELAGFLLCLLISPEKLRDHVKRATGALILRIAYGYISEHKLDDPLIDQSDSVMHHLAESSIPGAFMVDIIPWLRYVPGWFPGTGWQKLAKAWKAELCYMIDKPYEFVNHQLNQGINNTSFLARLLAASKSPVETDMSKLSAASLYNAGIDTTTAAIETFFLAMSAFPRAQRMAQLEIDRIVDRGRMPTAADRDNLPYIEALLKEVLRWQPVGPMGVPHYTTEDDFYKGYFIPKRTVVMTNIHQYTHDRMVYKDPMDFKPERFIKTDLHQPEQDPKVYAFGFGRRVCPGRVLAENFLYLTIVQTLAVFNIRPPVENGIEIKPPLNFVISMVGRPERLDPVIELRSSYHETLIRSIESRFPWPTSDGDFFRDTLHN